MKVSRNFTIPLYKDFSKISQRTNLFFLGESTLALGLKYSISMQGTFQDSIFKAMSQAIEKNLIF